MWLASPRLRTGRLSCQFDVRNSGAGCHKMRAARRRSAVHCSRHCTVQTPRLRGPHMRFHEAIHGRHMCVPSRPRSWHPTPPTPTTLGYRAASSSFHFPPTAVRSNFCGRRPRNEPAAALLLQPTASFSGLKILPRCHLGGAQFIASLAFQRRVAPARRAIQPSRRRLLRVSTTPHRQLRFRRPTRFRLSVAEFEKCRRLSCLTPSWAPAYVSQLFMHRVSV